jgi:hypothetical protein
LAGWTAFIPTPVAPLIPPDIGVKLDLDVWLGISGPEESIRVKTPNLSSIYVPGSRRYPPKSFEFSKDANEANR